MDIFKTDLEASARNAYANAQKRMNRHTNEGGQNNSCSKANESYTHLRTITNGYTNLIYLYLFVDEEKKNHLNLLIHN